MEEDNQAQDTTKFHVIYEISIEPFIFWFVPFMGTDPVYIMVRIEDKH
jgi:hypothetical protein